MSIPEKKIKFRTKYKGLVKTQIGKWVPWVLVCGEPVVFWQTETSKAPELVPWRWWDITGDSHNTATTAKSILSSRTLNNPHGLFITYEPGVNLGNMRPWNWFLWRLVGVPGWLSRLSFRLWLRSWSRGSWAEALPGALCQRIRAWSLLLILRLLLSLCTSLLSLSMSLFFLSLCPLSLKKNKH